MKKIFTKLMLLAVAAAALVSCENKFEEQTPSVELTQTVTLSAEKPTQVRTELIEGVPYWSKGDQIGVYVVDGESYKNYAFKNDNEEATLTTSFTGETAVANTLFVYYPYTNFTNPVTEKGVKVEILANQEPTATSFDGRTDLMIAKPVQLDTEGKQLNNLEFARVAAIVKIVLKDNTGNLAGQHVSSLTMTAANNLVGRVYLDVVNQEINSKEGLYYGGAPSVTATYAEATQYEIDGTNATYVIVYPQTLAAGSKLTIGAATEGYAISKEITLPSDIELLAGKVTTLNVSLAAENVVKEEAGLDLPIEDDFAWATGTSGVTPNKEWWSSDFAYTYGNNGVLRLGKSGECGHITTSDLNLSEPFTVVVDAKAWSTETSQVAVTVGDVTQTSANLPAEAAGFTTYVFKFDAAGKKEAVKIAITGKRGFIDNLKIVAGHDYVLPPVLTVSTAEISGVSHEGEAKTFTYSVTNPVDGVSATVTDNADWISTADNNGTVTVTIAANEVEEAREGVVTVTYGDLTKTVTVKQNAKPGATEASWVRVTSLADITAGTYVIICGNYVLLNNSGTTKQVVTTYANKGITITNNSISTTVPEECKWSFTGSNTAMTLSPINASTNLYSTKSGDGLRIGTTKDTWSFSNGSSASCFYLKSANKSTHLAVYNNQDWRSYTSATQSNAQSNMSLYKLVEESGGEGGGSTPEPEEPETPGTGGGEVVESDNITITPVNIAGSSNTGYKAYSNAEWIMTFGSGNGAFGSNSNNASNMKLGDNYVVATPLNASITSTTANYAAIISKFDLKGISKITLSGTKKTSTMQIGITYSTDGGATWTKLADFGSNTTFTFTAIPSARYAIVLKSNGGDSRYQSFSANFSGN